MKASCFGPGAKAGGPNYLRQFVHMRPTRQSSHSSAKSQVPDVEAASTEEVENSVEAEGWVRFGCSRWPQEGKRLSSLAQQMSSLREDLLRDRDPSQVLGQRNLFRLKLRGHGVVAICEGANDLELLGVLIALESLGLDWPLIECRSQVPADDPWKNASVTGEEREELLARRFLRVRAVGTPSIELATALTKVDGYLDASPFLGGSALELHKYLQEQTLSSVDHRHGYLGMQPPVAL